MVSSDVNLSELKSMLEIHFARTQAQLAEMRADNAEFKEQIKDEFNSFKSEVLGEINSFKGEILGEINSFKGETHNRFESLQTQIYSLQLEVNGLKHDVAGLYTWDYWILSIILAVFVLPQFAAGVTRFFVAVKDGVAGILSLFRKDTQKA